MSRARRRDSGACQGTRRSNKHCAITISIRSVSPESPRLPTLNLVEPPWYVTRMPGGVTGTARAGLPMSINSRRERATRQRGLWAGWLRCARETEGGTNAACSGRRRPTCVVRFGNSRCGRRRLRASTIVLFGSHPFCTGRSFLYQALLLFLTLLLTNSDLGLLQCHRSDGIEGIACGVIKQAFAQLPCGGSLVKVGSQVSRTHQ